MPQNSLPFSIQLLRQPLSRLVVLVGLGILIQSSPVHASGFLDVSGPFYKDNWNTSPVLPACDPQAERAECYEFTDNQTMVLASAASSAPNQTTLFTADPVPSNVLVSFTYQFDPAYSNFQSAYYSIGATQYALDQTTGTDISFWMQANDVLTLGIYSSVDDPAILTISNFNAVPAPLPLLGGAAAFGWIRRRRAYIRKTYSPRKTF